MAGENNETEGTEPKTFKENFTDFAKNLGSSLNVFKQNVQNAIDGVNKSVRSDVSAALSKYWAKEYDPFGKGDILNVRNMFVPEFYGSTNLYFDSTVAIDGYAMSVTVETPDINGFGIVNITCSYINGNISGNYAVYDNKKNKLSGDLSRMTGTYYNVQSYAPTIVLPANGKVYYIAFEDSRVMNIRGTNTPYVTWLSLLKSE